MVQESTNKSGHITAPEPVRAEWKYRADTAASEARKK